MSRCSLRVVIACGIFSCLPVDLLGGELFPGYFCGSVGVGYIASKQEVLSAGQAEYFTYLGSQNYQDPFLWQHKINNATAGTVAKFVAGSSTYEYNLSHRVAALTDTCYRGRLEVAEGCVSQGWGSAETCSPSDPAPGGGIPGTEPGDGTGSGADPRPSTPIVIDMGNDGYRFSSYIDGCSFDLNADGLKEWTAWTAPAGDEAFLALDRNFNGTIDSGMELFGDRTPQPISSYPNGFEALLLYDQSAYGGNGDGVISAADLIFSSLILWRDANHDGVSQRSEIQPVSGSFLRAIDLEYILSRRQDRHGNLLRWASRLQLDHGWRPGVADVIFALD